MPLTTHHLAMDELMSARLQCRIEYTNTSNRHVVRQRAAVADSAVRHRNQIDPSRNAVYTRRLPNKLHQLQPTAAAAQHCNCQSDGG